MNRMNVPNSLTSSRIVLSPLYFVLFFIPIWTGTFYLPSIILLWLIFIIIELTDLIDGAIARSRNQVTDIGKLLDPFADVISRLTYFIAFTVYGIMPAWIFIVFLYREFGIIFIRLLLYRKGIALAARSGGKLKAFFYALSGAVGLAYVSLDWLDLAVDLMKYFRIVTIVIFVIAALLSLISFIDYFLVYRRNSKQTE